MGAKRVIKRGTGTGTLYFDSETQRAIEQFQLSTENEVRHGLYLTKTLTGQMMQPVKVYQLTCSFPSVATAPQK